MNYLVLFQSTMYGDEDDDDEDDYDEDDDEYDLSTARWKSESVTAQN